MKRLVADLCPFCEEGTLGFYIDGDFTYLLCDECSLIFLDPKDMQLESALFTNYDNNWLIPGTNISIANKQKRWASFDELAARGWDRFIVDPEVVVLEHLKSRGE